MIASPHVFCDTFDIRALEDSVNYDTFDAGVLEDTVNHDTL